MSSKYWVKGANEKRAAAKGPRKIKKRGASDRRIVDGVHVTKGRRESPGYDIAATSAGDLYRTFFG